jgi:hypothetical protein
LTRCYNANITISPINLILREKNEKPTRGKRKEGVKINPEEKKGNWTITF